MFSFLFRKKAQAVAQQSAIEPLAAPASPRGLMPSEGIHIPPEKLTRRTALLHYAISSLREELEAVDWYRQRADDTEDEQLKAILLHNANEEIEHAAMLLEWLRRTEPRFDKELKEYLFKDGPITELENKAMGRK
jgi:ferritin-like protein